MRIWIPDQKCVTDRLSDGPILPQHSILVVCSDVWMPQRHFVPVPRRDTAEVKQRRSLLAFPVCYNTDAVTLIALSTLGVKLLYRILSITPSRWWLHVPGTLCLRRLKQRLHCSRFAGMLRRLRFRLTLSCSHSSLASFPLSSLSLLQFSLHAPYSINPFLCSLLVCEVGRGRNDINASI